MSIEQHEIELKELLTRVMREPLLPLQVQLDKTGKNVAHLDQQLSELRDVEMGGMGARLDAVEKVLKRLRSWAEEEAVNELERAILPPIQEALDKLTLRIDSHAAMIAQPVQSICQDVAQTAMVVEQLAEHSAQARALAVQRDVRLGEQVNELSIQQVEHLRLTQVHVRDVTDAAVDRLSAMCKSAIAAQQSNLQRLVEVKVSKRIDELIEHSMLAKSLAVQRDASLGEQMQGLSTQQTEQWRIARVDVREAMDASIERLSVMSASASATHQSNLQRLVEVEVSKRIDKLIMLGRLTVSLAVAAVCAASGCLALLARSLQWW